MLHEEKPNIFKFLNSFSSHVLDEHDVFTAAPRAAAMALAILRSDANHNSTKVRAFIF